MLPSTQDYKISLLIGEDSFRTLEKVEVVMNPLYPSEPWFSTGGLAIVFKILINGKAYALKCFYKEAIEREERLDAISRYLKGNPNDYFLDFEYLENELWVEVNGEGEGYPVLLMEWVEGQTLDNYLKGVCETEDRRSIQNLYYEFCTLTWWLQQQPIAHGDLKHDNIIVLPSGKLKLIDYDGMFVPEFTGRNATELGSPCYQHPNRNEDDFNGDLDDYSLGILLLTIKCLRIKPELFNIYYSGDGILFDKEDLLDIENNKIADLKLNDEKVSELITLISKSKKITFTETIKTEDWINYILGIKIKNKRKVEEELNKVLEYLLHSESSNNLKNRIIDSISINFNLNLLIISRFEDKWNWIQLTKNKSFPWNEEIISKYEDNLYWAELSKNESLPWNDVFIEKYKDKWRWGGTGLFGDIGLTNNKSLPWNEAFIEKYKDKWNWGRSGMSSNEFLPWNEAFIEKYKDKWYWEIFGMSSNNSIPWDEEFMEKYRDKTKHVHRRRSQNKYFQWIDTNKEKYKNKLKGNVYGNEAYTWYEDDIENYRDNWDLEVKCFPWNEEFIEKYKDKWNWAHLSESNFLPWSEEFIEKYKDKWYWQKLSENTSLPWDEVLISKFADKWNWTYGANAGIYQSILENKGIPWNNDLILKYKNRIDFESSRRYTSNSVWTLELVSELIDFKIEINEVIFYSALETYLDIPVLNKIFENFDPDAE